jgi:hypothetical protein
MTHPKRLHSKQEDVFTKEEINHRNDKKIKDDFPGYPHPPSAEEYIKPETDTDKATAAVGIKDGEKKNKNEIENDKQISLGSADAFEESEKVKE